MDIIIKNISFFSSAKEWDFSCCKNENTKIIYVKNGLLKLILNNKKITLYKNDIIVLRPYELCQSYEEVNNETQIISIEIADFINYDIYGICTSFSVPALFDSINHNITTLEKSVIHSHIIKAIILQTENDKKRNKTTKQVTEIYNWINENISSQLTVEKVAKHFDYNSEHLSRIFKKEYNYSLKKLIDIILIKKIKDYLIHTDYTVREITELLNYNDSSTLVNFFKYHEKISPAKYRNSLLKEE